MDAHTELRPDVSLVPRGDHLYVCASTGTLRVPVRVPASGSGSGAVRADAVPEQVVRGLRSRGLAYQGEEHTHPLYGELAAVRAGRPVAVAPGGPGGEVSALLERMGLRTVPDDRTAEAAAAVLPLSLPEEQLVERVTAALEAGTPLVTYLDTPTRLFLATLGPPRTPCPVCVVRRLRANHVWQPIADLPLDVLFGAADTGAWPSTAVAAGLLAHEVLTLMGPGTRHEQTPADAPTARHEQSPQGAPTARHARLTEVAHGSLARTEHRLFHLPGCPACAAHTVPPRCAEEPAEVDNTVSWERMRGAVDELTGMVLRLRVDDHDGALGEATYARTAGMTKTHWFSPVTAEARGGAVKSDPVTARVCAVGETLERYAAGVYDPDSLVRASVTALGEEAVDPRALPLGSAAEYARHTHLAPCDPDVEIDWVPGRSLVTGRTRYVPACAVYLPYRFPPGHRAWYDPISTGLAAGGSYHHAVQGGLMESVERDASVVFWENRLVLPTLDLDRLPDGPARRIVERMRAQGVTVTAKDMTTDLGIPAVGVRFLRHTERRPVVTHSARADLDPHAALLGALEEGCLGWAGARLWQENLDAGETIPGPDDVLSSLKEFSLFYWAPDRLAHLAFWDEGPLRPVPAARPSAGLPGDVEEAVRRLAARGHEAVAVDITPVDVAECGVRVVRTVVPGLCPITLRSDFHRRGGPRVFKAPVAMGVRATPLTEAELNPLPLPFL
ncbi:YcaO-like family protein [Streptomyces sp. G44]|uniref:YcaO-like family protein n=1 Tax=Streptomyces sp. G44 TaxID=2807632 RepID=UPI00195F4BC5|nr:YcaO-like family protein [Streptomyces sp. G44]MBM7171853.1 YcaO-like family protein [Streptomyces sp. G44]